MSTPNQPQDPYSNPPGGSGQPAGSPPPYGQQPYDPAAQPPTPPAYQGVPYGGPALGYPKNSLGVWALVLSILSLVCCGFLSAIPALIIGNNAKQAVARGEANNGGIVTASIVIGWVGIALSLLSVLYFFLGGGWDSFQQGFQDGWSSSY